MRDLTIGQYYAVDSPVHALDPRTKLLALLLYVVLLFFVRTNPLWYLLPALLLIFAYAKARIPARYVFRGMKPIFLLIFFTLFFRMTLTPGEVIAEFWIFDITREGVVKAIQMSTRILLMVGAAMLLSYTTTPRQTADGMELALSPLEKIGIPIHSMSVMLMIAFRFIPVMTEEINILMDAQAARGAEFDSRSIWKRTKYVTALPLPIFISCVGRAIDLAMAMEARGYEDGAETTRMDPLAYSAADRRVKRFSLFFFVVYGACLIYFR